MFIEKGFIMKKIFSFIFVLLFCQQALIAMPALHICTVATQQTQGVDQLLHSCKVRDVNITILGMGTPFKGLSEKLIHVQKYIQTLPDEDVVLFVDGYDVLILATEKEILKKFLKMNKPFIISVEKFCYPFPKRAADFPESPTSYKYINSGSYMGYVGHLKKIFSEISPIRARDDDQGLLTLHFFKHPDMYAFDYYCELFWPLVGTNAKEVKVSRSRCAVNCLETGSIPCVVHGNGSGRKIYQQIYDTLFSSRK